MAKQCATRRTSIHIHRHLLAEAEWCFFFFFFSVPRLALTITITMMYITEVSVTDLLRADYVYEIYDNVCGVRKYMLEVTVANININICT